MQSKRELTIAMIITMKKLLYIALCVFAALGGILPQQLHSLTVEVSGGLDNLVFNPENDAVSTEVTTAFEPNSVPFGLFRLSGIHKDVTYNLSILRDPILKNRLFIGAKAGNEYFTAEAGPMLAVLETPDIILKPGAIGGIWFSYPGLLFVHAIGASTLEISPDKVGNFTQFNIDGGAGFWLPHLVASANISFKSFTIRQQSNFLTEDSMLKYFFRGLIHTKNIPFTIQVDMGMATLKRSYIMQASSKDGIESNAESDTFTTLFAGLEGVFSLTSRLKLLFGAEISIMSLDEEAFQMPESFLPFRMWTGVSFTFGRL